MLNKEKRIVLTALSGLFLLLTSVCFYGFTVGGEPFSLKYILYCFVTSFIMTSLAFFFILKKDGFKKLFLKDGFVIAVIVVAAVQFFSYQPLNKFTSADAGVEYEVEIIRGFEYRDSIVRFADKEGIIRELYKNLDISYMFLLDGELSPETGGRMIVRETVGGFNHKYFEIVKVTYAPEDMIW